MIGPGGWESIRRSWVYLGLSISLWVLAGMVCAPLASASEELDLRLHFAWGGGEERAWSGRLAISAGSWSDLRLLGTDADAPGSIQLQGQQILILARHPKAYDGVEVSVRASREAELRLELLPKGELQAHVITVPIEKLLTDYVSEPLDERQNRLVVRRAPGDTIRLGLQREHLIFAPGESFLLEPKVYLLGVPAGTNLRAHVQLTAQGQKEVLWEDEIRDRADDDGSLVWPPITVPLPPDEGVYELTFSVTQRRRAPAFGAEKQLALRRVQLVIVNDQNPSLRTVASPSDDEERELLVELDPTQANWWQRLTRLPQWTLLPGFRSEGPLSNLKYEKVRLGQQIWTRLPAGGWLAYPLPINDVGALHEVELTFPANAAQSLGMSLVEPNAAGKVMPVGLDTGIRLTDADVAGIAVRPLDTATHRIPFWPRTQSPLVLLTNFSNQQPATFGTLRVYRRSALHPAPTGAADGRTALAFLERPLFPEAFNAPEALDAETGRSLEDWVSFWEGGQRMIQHVQHLGYDGLALMCVSEGSSLYPSRLLQPNAKHDRGIFFSDGRDPVRKDVLEMLFRLCNRDGVKLVPMLEFATPLPELERQSRDGQLEEGVSLVNQEGVTWLTKKGGQRGRGAYYNPADPRVQQAMRNVLQELLDRYAHHPSFGGVVIHMTPEGYGQFPDQEWGTDTTTTSQFRTQRRISALPTTGPWPPAVREAWLDWRSERLAKLYGQMAQDLAAKRSDATLYLSMARLAESGPLQRAMRPTLPRHANIEVAMRELGLNLKYLEAAPNISVLRPYLHDLDSTATTAAAVEEFNEVPEVSEQFRSGKGTGALFLHEPTRLRLPSFDEMSPYGKSNTLMSLLAQMSSVGIHDGRRWAQAMSQLDAQQIFDGGWTLPLTQSEAAREFLQVYRQLPRVPFEPALATGRATQPLQARVLSVDGATYLYLVNDSPWVVGAAVQLEAPTGTRFQWLAARTEKPPQVQRDRATWNVTLSPYGIVGLRADRANVKVSDLEINLPPDVKPALEDVIQKLGVRAARLRQPTPLKEFENPDFEKWAPGPAPTGWTLTGASKAGKQEKRDVFRGTTSWRIQLDEGPVLLHSSPLTPPTSGQLSVSVRAKTSDELSRPQVRLVLEVDGETYYPWSPIGVDTSERALTSQWKEFVFRVNQLPPAAQSLKIGVELSGNGDVLLDDVRLFDILILDDDEQSALALMLHVADSQRRNGMVSDCLRSLSGYWPQYLLRYISEAEVEPADRVAPTPPQLAPAPAPAASKEASAWPRLRRLNPRK